MEDISAHACDSDYAVGAFDLVSVDFLGAIVNAAKRAHTPVTLSLAESHRDYFDFELAMPTVEVAALRTSVPGAIHLDHGASLESAVQSVRMDCNGVIVGAFHLPFGENLDPPPLQARLSEFGRR
ncbi:MAG: class II fructose-bisphosphate aldolase [Acidobacteriaceae bacterium]